MDPIMISIIVIAAFAAYLWIVYNNLVTLRVHIKEAWSQIDVQLKRRMDLIPNLVETVKGYAKHEKKVFEEVTKARSALLTAHTPAAAGAAYTEMAAALKSLFAVAENYPNLKASETFLQLQKELSDTEDKVAYARQFYNTVVSEYNAKLVVFPNVLLSKQFGFAPEEFFEAGESERKPVTVKFD